MYKIVIDLQSIKAAFYWLLSEGIMMHIIKSYIL